MSSRLSAIALLFITGAVFASEDAYLHRPAVFTANVEEIMLPKHEAMSMLGVSYAVQASPNFYVGGASYGAFTGQRGGFFTVGPEVSWRQNLFPQWTVETGLYAGGGGGGGATALVGGGLMLRPHVSWMREFGKYRAGFSASNVSFPSGKISSNQFAAVFSADADFTQLKLPYSSSVSAAAQRGGVGFDRVHSVIGNYNGQIFASPGKMDTIGIVGFRMEQMRDENGYFGMEAAGAASGGAGGYAEFLGTAGFEQTLLAGHATLGARVAVGMGGGGAVSVGGGQLYKLGGYASANIKRDLHLLLESGYASAPDGGFRARYSSANLLLDLDHPHSPQGRIEIDRYEWLLGANSYLSTTHKDTSVSQMDAVTLRVNRYIDDTIYVSGQAHSAFRGREGGFSAGLFGVGLRSSPLLAGLSVGGELLLGAAGGGAVASSGGAIVAPNIFADWQLDELFALRLSAGKVKAMKGALDTPTVDLSIRYLYAAARS